MNNGHPPFFANAEVMAINPTDVFVPERIGFLHEDKAAALGRLMAVDGQRDPIKVVKRKGQQPWQLVTGMHRLRGAQMEGIEVFAIEVIGKPEDLADLEASENLHRRPLGPIERAKFTAALVNAAQERIARQHGNLTQYQRGAKARWDAVRKGETRVEQALKDETEDACAKIAQAYSWEESVGEALGMSRRTIHNDLKLYRLLVEPFPAATVEALAHHPVVGGNAAQLKAIAEVKDEKQRGKVIALIIDDKELSADEARVRAGIDRPATGPAPVAYQKFYNQIEGGWSRLGLPQRREFIERIPAMLGSDDMKRRLRDRLNQELGDAG